MIVVHVVFDYRTLPFIRSQSAYLDAFSPAERDNALEGPPGGEVDFTVYGWGLTTIYTSGRDAWPLDDVTFARVYRSREPFWTVLRKGNLPYNVYFANDRQFIYALGYAIPGVFDHLVRLAELTTLAAVGYVIVLIGNCAVHAAGAGQGPDGPRAAARNPRQLLPQAVPGVRAGVHRSRCVILALVIRTYFAGIADRRHQGGGDAYGRRRPARRRGIGCAAAPRRRRGRGRSRRRAWSGSAS